MPNFSCLVPVWKTSSLGFFEATSHAEKLLLGKQMAQCGIRTGTVSAIRGGISALHGLFVQRALTGALLVALVAGTSWLVL